jgi:hypothetical protein
MQAYALCAGWMLMFMHKAQHGRAGGQLLPLQPNSSFEDVRRILESSTPASEHMYGNTTHDHNTAVVPTEAVRLRWIGAGVYVTA